MNGLAILTTAADVINYTLILDSEYTRSDQIAAAFMSMEYDHPGFTRAEVIGDDNAPVIVIAVRKR